MLSFIECQKKTKTKQKFNFNFRKKLNDSTASDKQTNSS